MEDHANNDDGDGNTQGPSVSGMVNEIGLLAKRTFNDAKRVLAPTLVPVPGNASSTVVANEVYNREAEQAAFMLSILGLPSKCVSMFAEATRREVNVDLFAFSQN